MTEDNPGKTTGFQVTHGRFMASLMLAGLMMGYLYHGSAMPGFDGVVASIAYAIFPIAVTAGIAMITFAEKKGPKSGAAKMAVPALVFSGFWAVLALGGTSDALRQNHAPDSAASDAAEILAALIAFGLAMALTWALPVLLHWLDGRAKRSRDTSAGSVS